MSLFNYNRHLRRNHPETNDTVDQAQVVDIKSQEPQEVTLVVEEFGDDVEQDREELRHRKINDGRGVIYLVQTSESIRRG